MKKFALISLSIAASSFALGQIASTSGDIEVIAKPSDATLGNLESNDNVRVWLESTVDSGSGFTVDASGAGNFDSGGDLNGGTIAANTLVSSYMFHFDVVSGTQSYDGTVNFNQKILGVFILDASLDGSDALLGGGTTFFTGSARGWEPSNNEDFTISADLMSINFRGTVSSPMDEMRVITEGVPEPATMAIFGLGAAALAARKRRKA